MRPPAAGSGLQAMGPCRQAVCLALLLSLLRGGACARTEARARRTVKPNPVRFLLVSAPSVGRVSYMRVRHVSLKGGTRGGGERVGEVEDLITAGLVHPQGLAVDQEGRRLLVADPGQRKVLSFPLTADGGALSAGPPGVLADGPEARWVAADALGGVLFSDESRNQILRLPPAALGPSGFAYKNSTPEVVFDGAALSQVSAPGGVAADGLHTYWVNKRIGSQVGSLVRADERPAGTAGAAGAAGAAEGEVPQALARNADKSYGVCLAPNSVFFTQPGTTIYGVRKGGGPAVPVSELLTNPRGCAWDGDGTVYVADRGANAVFAFAGDMPELQAERLTLVAEVPDAFGVAVFAAAARGAPASVAALGLALLALARP